MPANTSCHDHATARAACGATGVFPISGGRARRGARTGVIRCPTGGSPSMPLFEIATAAQLAGSVVLALFFVLLERHDPRPYLADWMAAWIAQAGALAVFLAALRWGWTVSLAAYLFLEAGHGLLLCAAARHYRGGSLRRTRYAWMVLPLGAWAAA